ncbi:metallophosphoesterase [Massilibacteroides sp.]|uniref:metallophosphoesterase family protein n=1 Tax=Massilibacteroides sp. TaxID=2034766 RepID=UPI002619DA96|nr:metallophosphoesterase [Massilibacteroides sp.]MDD4514373.1 metallophosphoesterase [Massilibacteroides sp.]
MVRFLYYFLFLFLFISCDLIDYHPYDGRLSSDTETGINKTNIEKIESICHDKDTIRFIMISDTQRAYDETEDFVNLFNSSINNVDFILHGGDFADFGLKKEFEWAHRILSKLKVPYVSLIGNHDIIGNGEQVFKKMYGEENFSFIVGDVKFICLNTNALEYDYSNPIPDFNFLYKEIADSISSKRTIVAMHAPPGNEQFNNNVKEVFQAVIKMFPSLLFCLHGHEHNFKVRDIFNDGVLYYGCTTMQKRGYYLFTLTPDGYTYEEIEY